MLTARQVKLIDKQNFVKVTLNENFETFVVHVAALKILVAMPIYLL